MKLKRDEFRNPDYMGRGGLLKFSLKLILKVLSFPFRAPMGLVKWIIRQSAEWWKHRQLKHLLFGSPSLILAGVCVYFLIGHRANSRFDRAQKYLDAGEAALSESDFETARLYLSRGVAFDSANNDMLLNLARACQRTGDYARVRVLLQQLAPEDTPGHPEAHLWRASWHLQQPELTADDLRSGEAHLLNVLKVRPGDLSASIMLGELYFQNDAFDLAEKHLSGVVEMRPEYKLLLAKAASLNGSTSRAEFWADQAVDYFERKIQRDPHDLSARLQLADAVFFLERFDAALQILQRGLALHPNEAAITKAMANVLVRWSDSLAGASTQARSEQFAKLSTALRLDPQATAVFDRINGLFLADSEVRAAGTEVLLNNIRDGRAIGMSHLILGTILDVGSSNASYHLERAYEELPSAGIVLNNLSWALAHSSPPDLERALKLINLAIARAGEAPDVRYLDTRGVVLVKMGQWRDGIRDLEAALPVQKNNPETHSALAIAYEKIGNKPLAERHSELARPSQ